MAAKVTLPWVDSINWAGHLVLSQIWYLTDLASTAGSKTFHSGNWDWRELPTCERAGSWKKRIWVFCVSASWSKPSVCAVMPPAVHCHIFSCPPGGDDFHKPSHPNQCSELPVDCRPSCLPHVYMHTIFQHLFSITIINSTIVWFRTAIRKRGCILFHPLWCYGVCMI